MHGCKFFERTTRRENIHIERKADAGRINPTTSAFKTTTGCESCVISISTKSAEIVLSATEDQSENELSGYFEPKSKTF